MNGDGFMSKDEFVDLGLKVVSTLRFLKSHKLSQKLINELTDYLLDLWKFIVSTTSPNCPKVSTRMIGKFIDC